MRKNITTEEFIERSQKIHGDKYIYSKSKYISAHKKCIITCKVHGDFEQTPNSHIDKKYGCRKCGREKVSNLQKLGLDEFIKRANKRHHNKYDYSLISNYINNSIHVEIICPNNHIFRQSPYEHTKGAGCPICIGYHKSNLDIISKFRDIHGDTYSYEKVNYIGGRYHVIIGCKIHGDFKQIAYEHSVVHGCPKCNTHGKVMEPKLFNRISNEFLEEVIISNASPNWIGRQSLDIYFEKYNIAIEYQGIQHFKPTKFFGGETSFIDSVERDDRKRKLCEQNGCKLFYFTYKKHHIPKNYKHDVYFIEDELINEIKKLL